MVHIRIAVKTILVMLLISTAIYLFLDLSITQLASKLSLGKVYSHQWSKTKNNALPRSGLLYNDIVKMNDYDFIDGDSGPNVTGDSKADARNDITTPNTGTTTTNSNSNFNSDSTNNIKPNTANAEESRNSPSTIATSSKLSNNNTIKVDYKDIAKAVTLGAKKRYKDIKHINLPDVFGTASITELATFNKNNSDYAIIVPISPADDIFWIKNLYYGFNVLTVCDKDDPRAQKKHLCDIVLDDNYEYRTLAKKTNDMISKICKTLPRYKTIVKLDFDIVINKSYLVAMLKLMGANPDKRIYFGDPNYKKDSKVISMNGKVYAFTRRLLEDFCNCTEVPKTKHGMFEDNWFGEALANCALQINQEFNYNDEYIFIFSDESQIYHKEYTGKSVKLRMGRFA
ncbi:hypothetical protein AX774_g5790 [Zancudomyces culisetae]|uniref:Uncharacterized protein n=1 Tax=Zancudomyces culisetae TaxID=1213189 RepID=A0A1R1PIK1_ZANCU|nr:hypothetical protein AX774_g5790 [Zancudomyces culisetae]|eukprot:OMH80768.1 hypothetical protein AX774_g5790 [Zancudomyces culisetae]